MRDFMNHLHAQRVLTADELAIAHAADAVGTLERTMGGEFEVMSHAERRVPVLEPWIDTRFPEPWILPNSEAVGAGRQIATDLRFGSSGGDGLFEIRTPASTHPLLLGLQAQALVRAGLLPEAAEPDDINLHISNGHLNKEVQASDTTLYRQIRMLRIVEQLGGASEQRLLGHMSLEADQQGFTDYNWNERGVLGICKTILDHRGKVTRWESNSTERLEYRSLEYRNVPQLTKTAELVYFLGQGLVSPNHEVRRAVIDLDNWFLGYQMRHGLDNVEDIVVEGKGYRDIPEIDEKIAARVEYLKPYVQHLVDVDKDELETRTSEAVETVRNIFGMAHLPSMLDTEPADEQDASRLAQAA